MEEIQRVPLDVGTLEVSSMGYVTKLKLIADVDSFVTWYEADGSLVITIDHEAKPPKVGSEVTLDGSTFEIADVRKGNGTYQVLSDTNGTWYEWRRD